MECNLELDFQLGCKHHSEYSVFLLWNLIHLKNLKNVVKIKQVRIRHIFDLNTNSDITRKIVIYSSLCMGVHYKLVVSAFNVHSMKQTDVTMKFNQRKCICFQKWMIFKKICRNVHFVYEQLSTCAQDTKIMEYTHGLLIFDG